MILLHIVAGYLLLILKGNYLYKITKTISFSGGFGLIHAKCYYNFFKTNTPYGPNSSRVSSEFFLKRTLQFLNSSGI